MVGPILSENQMHLTQGGIDIRRLEGPTIIKAVYSNTHQYVVPIYILQDIIKEKIKYSLRPPTTIINVYPQAREKNQI